MTTALETVQEAVSDTTRGAKAADTIEGYLKENRSFLDAMTEFQYQQFDETSPDIPGIDLNSVFNVYLDEAQNAGIKLPEGINLHTVISKVEGALGPIGIDIRDAIADGNINREEFNSIAPILLAKKGSELLGLSGLSPDEVTEDNYPEAFEAARDYAEKYGIQGEGHLVGLASIEASMIHLTKTAVNELDNKGLAPVPKTDGQKAHPLMPQ